jgi:hypothetical protein
VCPKVPPFIGTPSVYGLTLDIALLLSGGQPAGVQIQGLGQIGNGSLFYCHPRFGFTFLAQPPGLTGTALRQVVVILPHPITAVIPPRPSTIASADAHTRRRRSSRYGRNATSSARMVATSCIGSSQHPASFRSPCSLAAPNRDGPDGALQESRSGRRHSHPAPAPILRTSTQAFLRV